MVTSRKTATKTHHQPRCIQIHPLLNCEHEKALPVFQAYRIPRLSQPRLSTSICTPQTTHHWIFSCEPAAWNDSVTLCSGSATRTHKSSSSIPCGPTLISRTSSGFCWSGSGDRSRRTVTSRQSGLLPLRREIECSL